MRRRISPKGRELIKTFESLKLKAYKCPADKWTIGYGHTGPEVYSGLVITEDQAETLLEKDLETFEMGVEELVKVSINDDQFAALVSFSFNVGLDIDADQIAEGLGDSTLLKKLNAGDYVGAADEFLKWNKVKGKVVSGLSRRRVEERKLFLSEA
jgi:lysozyme